MRKFTQVSAVLSLGCGIAAGWLDLWAQGTYSLVMGGLGLWLVDRWDDVFGDDRG